MFDRILIHHSPKWQSTLDAGLLAESLLFYKKIILLGNSVMVKDLVKAISLETAVDLVKRGVLEFHYEMDMVGIAQTNPYPGPLYFGSLHISASKFLTPGSPEELERARTEVEKAILQQLSGGSVARKKLAADFAERAIPFTYQNFSKDDIFEELRSPPTADSLLKEIITTLAPEFNQIPQKIDLSVSQGIGDRPFKIETNLPLEELQKAYGKRVPTKHSTLNLSSILAHLNGASQEMYAAAALNCEIASDTLGTRLNIVRLGDTIARHLASGEQIAEFSQLTLRNGQAIREAVNSSRVEFAQVLQILDKADQFRGWLQSDRVTDSMLSEYYERSVEDSWADKLPGKAARWSLFSLVGLGIDAIGGGGLATLGAQAVSAGDAFLLDKIVKGWRPHHFVEKELAPIFRRPALERSSTGRRRRKSKKARQ